MDNQLLNKVTSWISWTKNGRRSSIDVSQIVDETPNLLLSLIHPDVNLQNFLCFHSVLSFFVECYLISVAFLCLISVDRCGFILSRPQVPSLFTLNMSSNKILGGSSKAPVPPPDHSSHWHRQQENEKSSQVKNRMV